MSSEDTYLWVVNYYYVLVGVLINNVGINWDIININIIINAIINIKVGVAKGAAYWEDNPTDTIKQVGAAKYRECCYRSIGFIINFVDDVSWNMGNAHFIFLGVYYIIALIFISIFVKSYLLVCSFIIKFFNISCLIVDCVNQFAYQNFILELRFFNHSVYFLIPVLYRWQQLLYYFHQPFFFRYPFANLLFLNFKYLLLFFSILFLAIFFLLLPFLFKFFQVLIVLQSFYLFSRNLFSLITGVPSINSFSYLKLQFFWHS